MPSNAKWPPSIDDRHWQCVCACVLALVARCGVDGVVEVGGGKFKLSTLKVILNEMNSESNNT